MKYISQQCYPTMIYSQDETLVTKYFVKKIQNYNGYFPKGSNIDGFTFSSNDYIQDRFHLFSKYNLYESTNGINIPGIETSAFLLKNLNIGLSRYSLVSQLPIFIGDFINGQQVLYAKGSFTNYDLNIWDIQVILGNPEQPRVSAKNDFYDELVNAIDEIKASIDLLVSSGTVTTPNGGPATFTNQEVFDQKMDALKEKLDGFKI